MLAQSVGCGQFLEPARRFIHVFKGKPERSIVHRHQPLSLKVAEGFDGFVRPHVNPAKRIGEIGPDGKHRHFGRTGLADFPETAKVGAVPRVINSPPLVFDQKTPVSAVNIAQDARTPVLGRRQGDFPACMGEAFPPLQFDNAAEAKVLGQIPHAPGNDGDLGRMQPAQGGAMEMIEVGVGEQNQVNGRQVLDFQAGAPDSLQKEKPVGEIGINQHVQIRELGQKGGVPDPGQGDLSAGQFGKPGPDIFAGAPGQERFPDQFVKESARIEMFARGEVAEGARQRLSSSRQFGRAG